VPDRSGRAPGPYLARVGLEGLGAISPVRMRVTSSTGVLHTLPSPISPVLAAATMASTTPASRFVVDEHLDPDLGHEVDGVLVPR